MCNHNRDKRQPAISLGEYINVVVSRIVIDPLDLKQYLSIFLLTSARLRLVYKIPYRRARLPSGRVRARAKV